jgi:hypothetical protein
VVANHDALGDVEPEARALTDGLAGARAALGSDLGPAIKNPKS